MCQVHFHLVLSLLVSTVRQWCREKFKFIICLRFHKQFSYSNWFSTRTYTPNIYLIGHGCNTWPINKTSIWENIKEHFSHVKGVTIIDTEISSPPSPMKGKMQQQWRKSKFKITYEKESIFRTLGAGGMSINNELEKKEMRLLASKLDGTSIADSFSVSNRWSLLIYRR